eukprot:17891_4
MTTVGSRPSERTRKGTRKKIQMLMLIGHIMTKTRSRQQRTNPHQKRRLPKFLSTKYETCCQAFSMDATYTFTELHKTNSVCSS